MKSGRFKMQRFDKFGVNFGAYSSVFFNFSVPISIPEGKTHVNDNDKLIGTFGFIAPECITTGNCNEKRDVYSFGALLLELLTGKQDE